MPETRQWFLMPIPIDGIDFDEFATVLDRAWIELRYKEWDEANRAAQELKEVGGVKEVIIYCARLGITKQTVLRS
jgi:hypothetical protein